MFETITRRINGGLNGLADRLKYYNRARQVLGFGAIRGVLEPASEGDVSPFPEFTRGREMADAEPPVKKTRRQPTSKGKRASTKPATKKAAPKTGTTKFH